MSRATVKYLVDRRAKIDAAIDEVLQSGQSMSLDDGISYTRSSLNQLRQMRKEINGQIARVKGSNPFFQAVNMSGEYT